MSYLEYRERERSIGKVIEGWSALDDSILQTLTFAAYDTVQDFTVTNNVAFRDNPYAMFWAVGGDFVVSIGASDPRTSGGYYPSRFINGREVKIIVPSNVIYNNTVRVALATKNFTSGVIRLLTLPREADPTAVPASGTLEYYRWMAARKRATAHPYRAGSNLNGHSFRTPMLPSSEEGIELSLASRTSFSTGEQQVSPKGDVTEDQRAFAKTDIYALYNANALLPVLITLDGTDPQTSPTSYSLDRFRHKFFNPLAMLERPKRVYFQENTTLDQFLGKRVRKEGPFPSTTAPSVLHMYSLRKVAGGAKEFCMRVRRDSDNAEIDIPFRKDGFASLSTIKAFCGDANGYVADWYDQMADIDMTNSTAATQPLIYENGQVTRDAEGKPAIKFNNAFIATDFSIEPMQNTSTLATVYTWRGTYETRTVGDGVFYVGAATNRSNYLLETDGRQRITANGGGQVTMSSTNDAEAGVFGAYIRSGSAYGYYPLPDTFSSSSFSDVLLALSFRIENLGSDDVYVSEAFQTSAFAVTEAEVDSYAAEQRTFWEEFNG